MASSRRPPKDALTRELLGAIDQMQDLAPGTQVRVSAPPESVRAHTPWKLVAEFEMPGGMTYDDIVDYLSAWATDSKLRRAIGKNRMSRMIVRYKNKKGRGSRGEYLLAKMGGWDVVASVALERVTVRDGNRDSLSERYGNTSKTPSHIESLIVWFSSATSSEVKIGRQKKAAKAKASKGKRRVRY